jgi:prolyl oligopeptidase
MQAFAKIRRRIAPCASALVLAAVAGAAAFAAARLGYPQAPRGDVVDVWHGKSVPDPYRWLEADPRESRDVSSWIAAENQVTQAWLGQVPERPKIKERLRTLWNYERYSAPQPQGKRWFYTYNSGLQNQPVLFTMDAPGGTPAKVIDPNEWAADGTVALASYSASDDGRYLAYARSGAGSDWRTWQVRDLTTGKDLEDKLEWTKFTNASWTHDNAGFFYSRYDAPPAGQAFQALNKDIKLVYHRLGTPQSEDTLVYYRADQPDWDYAGQVSEDGRYLVITVHKGTDQKNRLLYKDLTEPYGMPVELIAAFENEYDFVGNDGPVFYLQTDLDAPKGKIIAIDTRRPERDAWRTLVPEAAETIQSADLAGNQFLIAYLKDATTRVRSFGIDGAPIREVTLPGIGTAFGFNGRRDVGEVAYIYTSFNTPPTVYRYDLAGGASTLWKRPEVAFKPDDFEVKQVFYQSKDGTKVPMFIVHRKGLKLDGDRPTLLYGYGGFRISMTPTFAPARVAWMEMGGVFALPNLRGGGEYGEAWHHAGTRTEKQHVFDDFIAAGEWLIANKYTRPARLAISGGSNGGLLVGACLTQRPDLFGATLPAVGVMDMLRFQKFTAGRYWVDDYGSADDPAVFPALLAYSPYHNVRPGTKYPATLITTADTDDRVIPMHSFKFAAAMQNAQAGDAPVLIRIETSAGHGGGKPTGKQIEETADQYAFLVRSLGMEGKGR